MEQSNKFIQSIGILFRWRKFIITNIIAVVLLTVGITLLLPNWYKSTTSLLPPKQPDIFGSLGGASSLLKGLGGLGKIGGLGQRSGSYNYFAILRSRSTLERVVSQFDLITVYDTKDRSLELAVKELTNNTSFEEEVDDNISIQVYDKDPVRAADMANYFVEVLNDVNTRLSTLEARTNREFIEQRLTTCSIDLKKAEDALKSYQERSGMIISVDENSSSVSAYAELYAMKVKKEIEASVLKQSVAADDSYLRQVKMEITELTSRLEKFPQAGLESIRLFRDVITQQRILEFILPIYEQAKIEEQKNIPVLLVLDKAVPAEKKTKPQRMLILFLVTSIASMLIVLLVFLLNGWSMKRDQSNEIEDRLHRLADSIARFYRIEPV